MSIVDRISGKLRGMANDARRRSSMRHPEFAAAEASRQPNGRTVDDHLADAARWIGRAQDATPDDGVARSYSLVYKPYFGGRGWVASYPETTGYIIPTLYDYAARTGEAEWSERAGRMAAWESDIQLASGAVQGGIVSQNPSPAIFNTGQVLFGWIRAHQETGDERYGESAIRAGTFLLDCLSDDGGWYKGLSEYAGAGGMTYRAYNVRCAWALALLGASTGEERFSEGARRAAHFSVERQLENGWFPSNCLYNPDIPYLHTIAYAARGLLETGFLLGDETVIDGGRRAADAVLAAQRDDGSISGRFDREWSSIDQWSCLTGVAQIALCWGRMIEEGHGSDRHRTGVARASEHVRSAQLYTPDFPDLHGAIAGSWPLEGGYGAHELLNWAAKFYMDLLILEERLTSV